MGFKTTNTSTRRARPRPALRTTARAWAAALVFALSAGAASALAGCEAPTGVVERAGRLRDEWKEASLREAAKTYHAAAACWLEAGHPSERATALVNAGEIHLTLGEYELARAAFDAALQTARAADDRPAMAEALGNLTLALLYLEQIEGAAEAAREAVSVGREGGGAKACAVALSNAGGFEYMRGDWRRAMEYYNEALPLARGSGAGPVAAQILLNMGYVSADTGDIEKALGLYEEALALWRAAGHRNGEAVTLAAIGLAYTILGDLQRGTEYLGGKAIPPLAEIGNPFDEAAAHNSLGFAYQTQGQHEQSLAHYRRALAIFERIGTVVGQAQTVQYVGDMLRQSGREREALDCYERGLRWSRDVQNKPMEADALTRIGSLYQATGRGRESYEKFREALSIYRAAGGRRGQAATLVNIGDYFDSAGERQKALEHYGEASTIFRLVGDLAGESAALYKVARARRGGGDLAGARAAVEAALAASESLRRKVGGHEQRAAYFATVHQQFELYIDILMGSGDAGLRAAAFEAAERGRARSLLEDLAEANVGIRSGVDAGLLQAERSLRRRISAKAEWRVRVADARSSEAELAEVERELGELTAEYQRMQGRIRAASPRYAALVQPAPLTLREIQARVLDAETVLLEYALGEERSFVWAVTADTIKGFELPPRAEVEKAARRVYQLLTARNRQNGGGASWQEGVRRAEAEYATEAAALGRMLLGPVSGELGRRRVAVVADGALQYVPFAALPDPSAAVPAPLIVGHEVVVLPSASVLALMREDLRGRVPAPKSVAVLADPIFDDADERIARATRGRGPRASAARTRPTAGGPGTTRALRDFEELADGRGVARLPFSRREAEAIMASVPQGEGMLALGFRASRATATAPELSQYRVVHFATHSLLNSEHPELSGVLLSLVDESGRPQDGFLQLHEVYNLRLSAELVVLSACQTALGKDVRGEGLVGLTRGFMYAGAPRVVASLWKVDDAATAELMGEFYRSMLGEGMRPAAALRSAQVKMLGRARWRSPYYWAAFTLQGEWR